MKRKHCFLVALSTSFHWNVLSVGVYLDTDASADNMVPVVFYLKTCGESERPVGLR